MYTFTVQHIHAGTTTTISGNDIWHAMKKAGLNHNLWKEI